MLPLPAPTLIVSEEPAVIHTFQSFLSGPLWSIGYSTLDDARQRVEKEKLALLLLDLPDGTHPEALGLLRSLAVNRKTCCTVAHTHAGEEQVADLLRAGVADCVSFPNDLTRFKEFLRELPMILQSGQKGVSRSLPEREQSPEEIFESLPPQMRGLLEQVKRVAPQETTVLLMGETGTGKTRLARLIHQLSPRRNEPFQVVDCGALSSGLIESELFGHTKGAFTGADRPRTGKLAAAGCGTLLLDEVNSLPLQLQGKLLRAVEERIFEPVGSEKSLPVKARLIAASNVSLEDEVRAGRFRADLFYRLNVVGFFLPPLRDRRRSIVPLAVRFLSEFSSTNRPDVTAFSTAALTALQSYSWPGNVRELRNVVERAVALCPGPVIEWSDLPEPIREAIPAPMPLNLHQNKEEAEILQIQEALRKHKNKRAGAARELGISRVGLYKKLHRLGLLGPKIQLVEVDGPPAEQKNRTRRKSG